MCALEGGVLGGTPRGNWLEGYIVIRDRMVGDSARIFPAIGWENAEVAFNG